MIRRIGPEIRFVALSGVLVCAMLGSTLAQVAKPVNPDAKTLADFEARVKTYVDLHKKVEARLPALPKEATPEQIDRNQREFAIQIRAARPNAKPGEIFTPEMQTFVRKTMTTAFGTRTAEVRASIMDENPVDVRILVNERYPDEVPLATMPPEVLESLPKMLEELEYRFVGDNLVIFDVHAHIIVDYMPNALPK